MQSHHSNNYVYYLSLALGLVCVMGHFSVSAQAAQGKDGKEGFEYDEYSDDEESPGEQAKAPANQLKSTVMPYFEEKNKTIYARQGESVILDCPVKNFDESKQILWNKEDKPITNGLASLSQIYTVDNNFNLTIKELNEESAGHYSCSVMPQNVSRHILVKIGENMSDHTTTASTTSATTTTTTAPSTSPPNTDTATNTKSVDNAVAQNAANQQLVHQHGWALACAAALSMMWKLKLY